MLDGNGIGAALQAAAATSSTPNFPTALKIPHTYPMHRRVLLAVIVSIACGNDHTSALLDATLVDATTDTGPFLWSDANRILADAWCALEVRCAIAEFEFAYGTPTATSTSACDDYGAEQLCYSSWEGEAQCSSPYPAERMPNLDSCPMDSANVSCGSGLIYWVQSCNLAAPWSQGA